MNHINHSSDKGGAEDGAVPHDNHFTLSGFGYFFESFHKDCGVFII